MCEGCLVVTLIYNPVMTSDVKHVFVFLLAVRVSSLEKCLFKSSPIFKQIWVFIFSLLNKMAGTSESGFLKKMDPS